MLRMLAGLEAPSAGTGSFGGDVVSDGSRGWTIDPHWRNAGLPCCSTIQTAGRNSGSRFSISSLTVDCWTRPD
jgi:hypothetical protein